MFFLLFREEEEERMLAGLSVVVSRWSSLGGGYFVTAVKNKQFTKLRVALTDSNVYSAIGVRPQGTGI